MRAVVRADERLSERLDERDENMAEDVVGTYAAHARLCLLCTCILVFKGVSECVSERALWGNSGRKHKPTWPALASQPSQ
jgi:hypothetical protein